MSKKILPVIVLVLFIFSCFPSDIRKLAGSSNYYVAAEVYGPLEVIANITLDKEPLCVAVNDETNRVYVGVKEGLIVINGETDEVITEVLMDDDVVALAINPKTNRIFAGLYPGNVAVINGASNLKSGEIPNMNYNSRQYWLAVNPVTNLVYICDYTTTMGEYDRVLVYSGENFTFITAVNIPGSNNHTYIERVGVTVNPETNKVYATWSGDNTLYMIDGNTHEITEAGSPSSFSETVMVNSYTNYVYVGKAVLDGETLEEVYSDYHGDLKEVNPLSNILYTTQYEELYALNGSTHAVIDSLELHWWISSYSDLIAVNSKTFKVYMANDEDSEVVVVIPEFPSLLILPLSMIATLLAVTVYRIRKHSM